MDATMRMLSCFQTISRFRIVRLKTLVPVAALLLSAASAPAAEVSLIAPGGIRDALEKLIPEFEKKTGHKVKPTFTSGLGSKQQVTKGDLFDVPILQPPYPEVLASGNVVAKSAKPLASVAVGIAVKKGSPKPDISTPDAVKKLLLSAKSISYPNPAAGAAAGVSFDAMLKTLGIAEQMEPKLKRPQGGAGAMAMVAKGEVDFGLTFVSEMGDPGVELVGPLPASICPPTHLVGFIATKSKDPKTAKQLLDFLASKQAAPFYTAEHMVAGK
jgi:molybdate transport system substrate-binding protein